MPVDRKDVWSALLSTGHELATDAEYEHGYRREMRSDMRRYVRFNIGNEIYGLSIDNIVEISKLFSTTLVPRTPPFLVGIGNVRGTVMPVIDLSARLRLGVTEKGPNARVLIVRQRDETYALTVDRVVDVLPLAPDSLEETPGGLGAAKAEFIQAIGRHEGRLVILLDLQSVLDIEHLITTTTKRGSRYE